MVFLVGEFFWYLFLGIFIDRGSWDTSHRIPPTPPSEEMLQISRVLFGNPSQHLGAAKHGGLSNRIIRRHILKMIYIFGFRFPNRRSSVSELRISSPAGDLLSWFRPIYPLPLSSLLPLQAISLRHKPLCASRIHRIPLDLWMTLSRVFMTNCQSLPVKTNISVRYIHNGV
jgi:hypothetical protein